MVIMRPLRPLWLKHTERDFTGRERMKMAKEIVDKCEGCQFYSNLSHKPASALKTIPLVWPFAVWGLDMVGPLRTGRSGFTHVLVAVYKFTKWIEAKPIKNL